MSLFDILKQKTPTPAALAQTTQQVESLISAKSGKAGATVSGPATSNIAEQQATQTAQVQGQAVQAQAQTQAAGLANQQVNLTEQQALQEAQFDESQEDQKSNLLRQTNAVLDEYEKGNRTLDFNRDKARLEQVGFTLRLTNDKYLSNLQREGKRSRLDSDLGFKEELMRSIFSDEEDLLRDDLEFRALMRADDREFEKLMAAMDIETALQIASAESKAANAQQMWQGIGGLVSGGIEAAAAYQDRQSLKTGEELDAGI